MEWRVTGIFAGRCCAVLFACFFCAAALAGDDDDGVELKILDAGGFAGADVYVPVTMSASTRPSAVAFWIEYDHTKLTFLDAEPGLVVTLAGKDVTWGFPAPGRISFLIFGLNDNRISSGQILLLKFEINSSALPGEEYPVQGLNESSTGPNAEPIDTDIDDGEVEVLNCFKPATPSNFTATDGIFGDRVQLTWSPVFGAQSYVVYRNSANDVSTAQVIATTILTFYSDSSAQGPSNLNSGGCSGGTNVNTSYNTYYYWVRAQNICGQSAPTSAESGYRGKAHLAKATATTLTKMPVLADESTTSLAIRLSANNAIDTQTIVVALNGIDNEIVRTAWSPLNDSGSDGWVWVTLGSPMEPGTTLTLEASARTIGGDAIAPVVAVFSAGHVLNSNALLPSGGPLVVLEYEAEHLPDFVESMGPAYRIAPEANFATPATVRLPVPNDVEPSELIPYLLVDDDSWSPGVLVDGWLASQPRAVEIAGIWYVEFEVMHGGIVQLGYPALQPAAAGLSSLASMLPMLLALTILFWATHRRPAARPAPPSTKAHS